MIVKLNLNISKFTCMNDSDVCVFLGYGYTGRTYKCKLFDQELETMENTSNNSSEEFTIQRCASCMNTLVD